MVLTLYYEPLSSPSRAVIAFLELNNIPHEKKHISVLKGETKSPEFLKINPNGLVPTIDDDGFIVWEHEAILRYLAETRRAYKYLPQDIQVQTLIDQYYPFFHSSMRPHVIHAFFGYNGLLPAGAWNKEAGRKKVEEVLKTFDEIHLKDKKYIAGDQITIADFSTVNELAQVYFNSDIDWNKYSRVKAYLERCLENPVIKATNIPLIAFTKGNAQVKKSSRGGFWSSIFCCSSSREEVGEIQKV